MADLTAPQKYAQVETEMLAARLRPEYTDAEEDAFLDRLDALWWLMTDEERAAENSRLSTTAKLRS